MVRKIDQTNTFPKFKGNWEAQTNLGPKLANLLQLKVGQLYKVNFTTLTCNPCYIDKHFILNYLTLLIFLNNNNI